MCSEILPHRTRLSKHFPPPWRIAIRRARQRYQRMSRPTRPSLAHPRYYCCLFGYPEMIWLALAGHWPLTERELRYIAKPPAAQREPASTHQEAA
jgi:hypothetical protein